MPAELGEEAVEEEEAAADQATIISVARSSVLN